MKKLKLSNSEGFAISYGAGGLAFYAGIYHSTDGFTGPCNPLWSVLLAWGVTVVTAFILGALSA